MAVSKSAVLVPLTVVVLVLGAVLFSRSVKDSVEDIEMVGVANEAGEDAYRAANQLLAPASEGVAHGSSDVAVGLASDLSEALSLTRSNPAKAFCQQSADGKSLAFLVRVPGASKLDDAGRTELVDRGWVEATRLAASLDPIPAELAFGLKGTISYLGILTGSVDPANPATAITSRSKGIAEIKTFYRFFAQ